MRAVMTVTFLLNSAIFLLIVHLTKGNLLPLKEHKVHNIVLYPDKHSWCKVTPIKQIISHSGCQAKNIDNNVCVGTCFSFSVPRTIPETPGDDQLHYCDSCQSSDSTWITVSLDCPEDNSQSKVEKSVEIIANCSCISCKEKESNPAPQPVVEDDDEYEDDADNFKQMYDFQQMARKHAAIINRKNSGLLGSSGHVTNNKHLDMLEEADNNEEAEVDEETFRQVREQIEALKD